MKEGEFTPIKEIGEFGLINRMEAILGAPSDKDVLVGIADDAAVYQVGHDRVHVLTTDALVEGVHFDRLFMPMEYLGMKSIAVNVSDIVAMNAVPRFAIIALGLPETVSIEQVEGLYRGIRTAGEAYGLSVVGGDTTASHHVVVAVSVVGEAESKAVTYRRGARPGDLLCVTGDLGGAYAGLKILLEQRKRLGEEGEEYRPDLSAHQYVIQRQLVPQARLDIVQDWATRGFRPRALIDISDGLASDVGHLCRLSSCGVEIQVAAIPIALETRGVADEFGDDVDTYALFGGEDYELLFAAAEREIEKMDDATFNVIGRFTAEKDILVRTPEGHTVPLGAGGYRHF